ncbi:MAG: hypothetical protein COA88_04880 [Kordia sp.]|nr:MAG: hypothetical protein COA88_04880 [Kordia sp.]
MLLDDEMKLKYKFFTFSMLLFCSVFGFSQSKSKDSVWVSVYKKDTNNVSYSLAGANYSELFYRNIQVPVYDSIKENEELRPIAQSIESLLKQTQLDKSYAVSEVKGTELERSLKEVEQLSFPFSSCITSKLAEKLSLQTNNPVLVSNNEQLHQLITLDNELLSTQKMLSISHKNADIKIDKNAYLRYRLLGFITGSFNTKPNEYVWKVTAEQKIVPYTNSYKNQYMNFDGTYKVLSKLVKSYKHLESYSIRIRNIKNVSQKFIGFDVNILSVLPYSEWGKEVEVIQELLDDTAIKEIINSLPKGILSSKTEELFSILKARILNLDGIATEYYNLISPNKIIVATNENNLIDITRKGEVTSIKIYNEKDGKNTPVQSYSFSYVDTDEIWVYGLKGSDYFEVSGTSEKSIPLKLIGGSNSDKYEIQNGEKIIIIDNKYQTFVVEKDKSKLHLSDEKYITAYQEEKYKHHVNSIKPKFGANPDDGLFIGVLDEYKVLSFDQTPFTTLHQVSANLYLGTLGFKLGYYGERANVYKGFNAFGALGYQSSNYSTNFFGFGNETPNFDDNLKLDYNRIRMSTFDVKLGILKREKSFDVSANLFFESVKIDETADRFVTSETLFFPSADFFDRKNYVGLSGYYQYKKISLLEDLIILPKVDLKVSADINEFSKTNVALQPSLYLSHPMYGDKITLDATISYKYILGSDTPFFQAANLGGSTGLRGYRNQRFTGQSLFYTSTNLKWHIKELKSEVLPLQFGILGGFDVGRVWQENETSSQLHTDFGAGFWLQTADLIKAELQAFKGDEGLRFSINIAIGF